MTCKCTVTSPDDWTVQTGNTIAIDVGRLIIDFCPLHKAAPELLAALEMTLQRCSDLAEILDRGEPYLTARFLRATVTRYSEAVAKATGTPVTDGGEIA